MEVDLLVTVWRHGEAGSALHDRDRRLTAAGRGALAMAVREFHQWLPKAGLPPVSACWHSPYVRTTETAELLCDFLGVGKHSREELTPESQVTVLDAVLPEQEPHLLLVSHQPLVSGLIAYWVDDNQLPPLMPGGYATLDMTIPTRGGASMITIRPSIAS